VLAGLQYGAEVDQQFGVVRLEGDGAARQLFSFAGSALGELSACEI